MDAGVAPSALADVPGNPYAGIGSVGANALRGVATPSRRGVDASTVAMID